MTVLEKQEKLKSQQDQIQKELDQIKFQASNEKARKHAFAVTEKDVDGLVESQNKVNIEVENLEKENENLFIKTTLSEIKRNVTAYIYDSGNSPEYKTIGEVTKKVTIKSLFYKAGGKDFKIEVFSNGSIEIDFYITGSFRRYKKIGTVVNKIDNYVQNQIDKNNTQAKHEIAKEDAFKCLIKEFPNTRIEETCKYVPKTKYGGGYETYGARIIFKNGIVIKVSISPNPEKDFTLSFKSMALYGSKVGIEEVMKTISNL
jgi:hypothetical protein